MSSDWPVLPAHVLEGELVEKAKVAQATLGDSLAAMRAVDPALLKGVEPAMADRWVRDRAAEE